MKPFFKKFLSGAKKFIIDWSEVITIPLAIVLWKFSPTLLRWLDPTAGTYDAGVFQILIWATVALLYVSGVVWLVLKLSFPGIFKFFTKLDDDLIFDKNIDEKNKLTTWQKTLSALFLLFIFFLSMVLLIRVL